MSKIKVFELTQKILEEAESYILGHKSQNKIELWYSRHVVFPVKFLMRGSEEFLKPFIKWVLMTLVFITIGSFILNNSQAPTEIASVILSFCLYVPMALVMFAVPSTYVWYGVKPKNIDAVVEYLDSFNIQSPDTIDCILSNIENSYARISSRISSYKWIVGALWALFTLILNQQMSIALKISPETWQSSLKENFIALIAFAVISLLALWIITSYKRASEILIKTLEFSLIEVKHRLQVTETVKQEDRHH